MRSIVRAIGALLLVTLCASGGSAADRFILLQSTTSTENSGLLDEILPHFTRATGIAVRVIAVGTGQALRNGRRGDADVLLVHARELEDAFVAEGYGAERRDVMYNDFVVVGPPDDPAGVAAAETAPDAFRRIAAGGAPFASRGDDSGTHLKERRIWEMAGIDPAPASGRWYLETGSGMGSTLNTAIARGAYALTDRGTWLSFRNKGEHRIVFEGDPPLHNPYGVILVNPARHPHVRESDARAFIEWLTARMARRRSARSASRASRSSSRTRSSPERLALAVLDPRARGEADLPQRLVDVRGVPEPAPLRPPLRRGSARSGCRRHRDPRSCRRCARA